jgi:hypothetical protein
MWWKSTKSTSNSPKSEIRNLIEDLSICLLKLKILFLCFILINKIRPCALWRVGSGFSVRRDGAASGRFF